MRNRRLVPSVNYLEPRNLMSQTPGGSLIQPNGSLTPTDPGNLSPLFQPSLKPPLEPPIIGSFPPTNPGLT